MTQRDLAFKWGLYGAVSLLLLLLQQFVLVHIHLLDTHPFLLPLLVAVVATLEQPHQAAAYALGLGVLCDLLLSPPFAFFYSLIFLVSAIPCALIAARLIAAKFSCSLINGTLCLLLTDLLHALLQIYNNPTALWAAMDLILREMLLTLPLLPLVYLLLLQVHRKTNWD
ncbi:MAG: hypothetical protein E7457_05340 [Ruminococcaceae bacterium]|nr:hypothetical protein [Oscillospiraceae bacterium]